MNHMYIQDCLIVFATHFGHEGNISSLTFTFTKVKILSVLKFIQFALSCDYYQSDFLVYDTVKSELEIS